MQFILWPSYEKDTEILLIGLVVTGQGTMVLSANKLDLNSWNDGRITEP